jgi:hypothetical protein
MTTNSAKRVERRRNKLRAQGLRPLQIWVPDVRAPGFAAQARRQGALVSASYAADDDVNWWLDQAEAALDDFYRGEP